MWIVTEYYYEYDNQGNIMTMPASEYWWKNLSPAQRDFIQTYLLQHDKRILLKDVVSVAFMKQQNIGWFQEPGFPESIMRII